MAHSFLVHAPDDAVGVAVRDLKLTANPHAAATMSEHIDLDVSEVITADMTLDAAADAVEALVVQTASGRWTAAEVLGHREFVLTRLHRTA